MNYFIGSSSPHRFENTAVPLQGVTTLRATTIGIGPAHDQLPTDSPDWPVPTEPVKFDEAALKEAKEEITECPLDLADADSAPT